MKDAQRELLSKGLADIAKGVFVAAPIAMGTGKLSVGFTLTLMALAVGIFNLGYHVAGGENHD
ncbi:hypothetical protein [Candidatus Entotheonella palauensis]|uniref:Uncharacterized protein n=1 Tax=Candidatus Entotheonella gemina TaxID=1429439 RepID=W4LR67_9BACT|nr:hypothetical protein [Candidatus Entotheonella palauensis]ETW99881.1 MAG: hypothetical protein ETSY2_40115 [Candidatus Entotheonella gemina]